MRVARYDEIPWLPHDDYRTYGKTEAELAAEGKQARSLRKGLFKGTPGQPGHYEMLISSYRTVKYYPLHRHNVDQVRYTLKGKSGWGKEHATPEGSLLYVPAGTPYGLYERDAGLELVYVQFEGANGAPVVDTDTLFEAHRELAKTGSFEKGIYTWTDADGQTHQMEASRAGWEHVTGLKEEYPPARYTTGIEMNPRNFAWVDVGNGAQLKELGTFTELGTRMAMIGVDPGGSYALSAGEQRLLLFVTTGAGAVDGQPISAQDGVMLDPGDTSTFTATERLEILLLGLPKSVHAR